jgi:hypothetical protein
LENYIYNEENHSIEKRIWKKQFSLNQFQKKKKKRRKENKICENGKHNIIEKHTEAIYNYKLESFEKDVVLVLQFPLFYFFRFL